MKRRNFLILGSALGLFTYFKLKKSDDFSVAFKKVESTIMAVQEHMFPQNSKLPSAKLMNVNQFLFETMSHKSFDKDIKAFVLEGAKELEKSIDRDFSGLAFEEKESVLRAYEETTYGSAWLSQIMTLTMEAFFCDPIYGANTKEQNWAILGAYVGLPRPQKRYMGVMSDV